MAIACNCFVGVAPGTYTLTTSVIQVPSAAGGGAVGYSDYQQQVHTLQGLDNSAGAGGLQVGLCTGRYGIILMNSQVMSSRSC